MFTYGSIYIHLFALLSYGLALKVKNYEGRISTYFIYLINW